MIGTDEKIVLRPPSSLLPPSPILVVIFKFVHVCMGKRFLIAADNDDLDVVRENTDYCERLFVGCEEGSGEIWQELLLSNFRTATHLLCERLEH